MPYKKNYLRLIFILIAFIVIDYQCQSADHLLRLNDGKAQKVRTILIKGSEYIKLTTAATALFPGSAFYPASGSLAFDRGILNFAPSSQFLLYSNKLKNKVAQLNQPVLKLGGEFWLPFHNFIDALEFLGIFSLYSQNSIYCFSTDINFSDKASGKTATASNSRYKVKRLSFKEKQIAETDYYKETFSSRESYKKYIDSLKTSHVIEPDYDIDAEPETDSTDSTNDNEILKDGLPHDSLTDSLEIRKRRLSLPPNVYILPSNLIRRELQPDREPASDTTNKMPINFKDEEKRQDQLGRTNNLFAGDDLYALQSLPEIAEIYAIAKDNVTELHVVAHGTIVDYHKPEFEKLSLKLRIKDAIFTAKDFSKAEGVYPIKTIKGETIKNLAVIRITLSAELTDCAYKKAGKNELIYTLITKKDKTTSENKKETPAIKKHESSTKIIEIPEKSEKKIEAEIEKESKEDTEISEKETEKKASTNKSSKRWGIDVIVIDPGHGGHDVGATSINGHYEKDVTLKIGKKLRELINSELPGTKVVMTRSDDRFIELYRRGKIANENKGKLFISIHVNAARTKPSPAKGFETYILRPGRNDDAVIVAQKENAVIKFEKNQTKYKELTDEELIIATMAQSSFVRFSELFARLIQEEVGKTTPLSDRGVSQAGFLVLVGASMPNVLFETGFGSNTEDEAYLNSANGQQHIAQGMLNAIKRYKKEYEKGSD